MMSVMSAQSTARNIPAEMPYSSAPRKAIGRLGAAATIARPTAPTAQLAQMTALAPDPVRDPAPPARPTTTVPSATSATSGMKTMPGVLLAQSHRPGEVEQRELRQHGAARQDRQRETRRATGSCCSRRMSVPHASAAIERHGRPSRDLADGPSRTRMTTDSIVATSRTPSAIEAERVVGASRPRAPPMV